MTVDRRLLASELVTHLAATGHKVALARRHPDGGSTPGGGFVPYVQVFPQPTVYVPRMAGAHVKDRTVVQLTCVANDPDLCLRVADDITALALAPPATLAGRAVTDVRLVGSQGPERDPIDDDLWFAIVLPRVDTEHLVTPFAATFEETF